MDCVAHSFWTTGFTAAYGLLVPHVHDVELMEYYYIVGPDKDEAMDLFASGIVKQTVSHRFCLIVGLIFRWLLSWCAIPLGETDGETYP